MIQVVRTSYIPEPFVEELTSVVDAKGWMKDQVPSLHDHLKAHQFKFECNEAGESRLFFKEWSTDKFWLPQTGLAILPAENPLPSQDPRVILPQYDPQDLKKLESTVQKTSAYLEKAGASTWWKSWLQDAWTHAEPSTSQLLEGNNIMCDVPAQYLCTSIAIPERWILDELKTSTSLMPTPPGRPDDVIEVDVIDDVIEDSDMSEVEMVSPTNIAGVGKLCTSWMGQKGLCDIENSLIVQKYQSQVKTLKTELNLLAKECTKAFADAKETPQVSKALKLCSTYYCPTDPNRQPPPVIEHIWKESPIEAVVTADKKEHATMIIGEKLVETITEQNREPPDVSSHTPN